VLSTISCVRRGENTNDDQPKLGGVRGGEGTNYG